MAGIRSILLFGLVLLGISNANTLRNKLRTQEFDHIIDKVPVWVKENPQQMPLPQLPKSTIPGTKLPSSVLEPLEKKFPKERFDNIIIHEDIPPNVDRESFTVGNDIHFKPGIYHPSNHIGQEILGREIAHVLQNRAAEGTGLTNNK